MASFLLKQLLARYMAPAGDGTDLGGDAATLDDDENWRPSPEERGDFLPGEQGAPAPAPTPAAEAAPQDPGEGQGQDGAEQQPQARQSGSVPHARFNEVNEQRKQAERERDEALALLEQIQREQAAARSQAQPPQGQAATQAPASPAAQAPAAAQQAYDFDAAEQRYFDAVMEGEAEKALQIRREINAQVREAARIEALQAAQQAAEARDREREAAALANAVQAESQAVLAQYPYLDTPQGQDALEMICARRDALVAQGKPIHVALREAADFIAPKFAPPAKDLAGAAPATDSRQAAAVARGAQASVAQAPTPLAGMGNRATGGQTLDVSQMDDEQFAQLSEADKRRLRGD